MTFNEAQKILGVDGGASPEDVRRAYLRRLKTCKPETDPEAFQQLRAAYDFLRSVEGPAARISIVEPSGSKLEQGESGPDAVMAPEISADEVVRSPAVAFDLQGSEESNLARPSAGHDPASPETIEASVGNAIARLDLILEEKRAEPVPVPALLHLALVACQLGLAEDAKQLFNRLGAVIEQQNLATRVLRGDDGALWVVAGELLNLPETFPSELRTVVAGSLLGDNPRKVDRTINALRERRGYKFLRIYVERALNEHAPTLLKTYGPILFPSFGELMAKEFEKTVERERAAVFSPFYVFGMAALLALWAIAAKVGMFDKPPRGSKTYTPIAVTVPAPPKKQISSATRLREEPQAAAETVGRRLRNAGLVCAQPHVRTLVQHAMDGLARYDCSTTTQVLEELRIAVLNSDEIACVDSIQSALKSWDDALKGCRGAEWSP